MCRWQKSSDGKEYMFGKRVIMPYRILWVIAAFVGSVTRSSSFFAGSTPCNPAKSTIGFFPCLNVLVNRHF
jgi:hypothetical protein